MNSPDDQEKDFQRREQELQEREKAIRLRELEAEIYQQHQENQPPLYETIQQKPSENKLRRWGRKLLRLAKFFGFVVIVLVAIKLAYWVAFGIMIGGIAWIGYKIFLEGDSDKD